MAPVVLKAMDLAGVAAPGEGEAASKQDVAEQLKERGLVVVDIANKYRSKELNVELFAHVKPKDLAIASRQLATMVTSGMSILRALYVLELNPIPGLTETSLLPQAAEAAGISFDELVGQVLAAAVR